MVPESHIAGTAFLQLVCGLQRPVPVLLVLFGAGAGRRVDLLQFSDGEGGFFRIGTCKGSVEVGEFRLSLLQFCNDQSHLQAPVAQMHVSDDLVPQKSSHALDTLPDNGGAQMPYMQGFCHIGAAVVNDDGFRLFRRGNGQMAVLSHFHQISGQISPVQFYIDEARLHRRYFFKHIFLFQLCRHCLRDLDGSLFVCLGRRHGPVALVFAQIRPVGYRGLSVGRIVTRPLKRLRCPLIHFFNQFFHNSSKNS